MTVPTNTALTLPRTGLGQALGMGIQQGSQKGLEGLLKSYLAKKQDKGMTEYQKLSSELREKEQERKIQTAMTSEFLKLGDPFMKTAGISADDVLPLSTSAFKIMKKENVAPAVAMDEAVSRFRIQKALIKESNFPKYKPSKIEPLKENIINSIKKGNITNRTLINKELASQGWPAKERIALLNNLKRGKPVTQQVTDVVEQKKASLRSLSQQEIQSRYKKMPGKTHKKKLENLKKALMREGYTIEGL